MLSGQPASFRELNASGKYRANMISSMATPRIWESFGKKKPRGLEESAGT